MSMQPRPWPDVPEQTARMARAAFRKGNLATRIRDELGQVYEDARFSAAFGVRGRPGISPAQLMTASALQFSENLTDCQAADAVRDRVMAWHVEDRRGSRRRPDRTCSETSPPALR
ncbi:hypothetical protein ACFHWS_23485 [Micromonospora sp. LOL_013]|uniref:hypothetical protein n=1 Tax=Micromonospora sp. LOL_013 TaxID=3345414 RepID=UPI003A846A75